MSDYTPDKWWQSSRIYAAIAAVLVLLLNAFGIKVVEADVVEILTLIGTLVAAGFAFWSKIKEGRKLNG